MDIRLSRPKIIITVFKIGTNLIKSLRREEINLPELKIMIEKNKTNEIDVYQSSGKTSIGGIQLH